MVCVYGTPGQYDGTEHTLISYVAYGRGLRSEIPLPELERRAHLPEIVITAAKAPLDHSERSARPLLDEHGAVWLIVGENSEGTVLSFPGLGDFVVDVGAQRVRCHWDPTTDLAAIRHALLDQVIPCLIGALGGTVLHASGVVVEGSAVLFAGRSGSGKSTLAGQCAAQGYRLLGDDAMVLDLQGDTWRALPSYPGLRLWRDSIDLLALKGEATPVSAGASKCRVDLPGSSRFSDHGAELSSIVMIERRPGPVACRQLAGSEAFSRLWGTVFGWPGTAVDQPLLDRVSALVNDARVLSVSFPDDVSVEDLLRTVSDVSIGR